MRGWKGADKENSNCGHFIWIDLRHFLEEVTVKEERKLAWKMVEAGVWLGTGESFQSEEPGWFRITFALPEGEMALGIRRLRNVLREAKREFVRAHIEKEEDMLIED
jgi:bifunctional pyridoxal-dependent enzyme with beta-cystathionase and maltose regulon repressor activities